jgi:hypothetical protein
VSFFALLKRGVYGNYFHVLDAHLHRYLAEADFRLPFITTARSWALTIACVPKRC